ncbi:Os11g0269366 [Oryza sativa Japonica Group]|uniref:Os11g0269366 protein n=1 Tax=Oryza sativa subsp. japonica TaxID=39947 RepID=A0A0P0Y106_ORYSJ|nr:Os11g0269366 [Oryza sativa Japonica Group]
MTASPSPSLAAGLQDLGGAAFFALSPRSPVAISSPPRAPCRQIRSPCGWGPQDLDAPHAPIAASFSLYPKVAGHRLSAAPRSLVPDLVSRWSETT